jgi:hypothetical protein
MNLSMQSLVVLSILPQILILLIYLNLVLMHLLKPSNFCPKVETIATDVLIVKQGISTLVNKTFSNTIIAAIEQVSNALSGNHRTETRLLNCFKQYPQSIYVI